MKRLLAGFIAGTAATIPMTIVMIVLHKLLASGDHRSLPPYEIAMRTTDKAGFWHKLLGKKERTGIAALAHLAFGGVAGIPYSLVVSLLALPMLLSGVLYGIAVWAANYLGVLPGLRLYPNQMKDHPGRVAATVAAHLVWGAAMGATLKQLAPVLDIGPNRTIEIPPRRKGE